MKIFPLASILLTCRGEPRTPWLERGEVPGVPWVDLSEAGHVAFGGLILLNQTLVGVDTADMQEWAMETENIVAATWLPERTTPLGADVYRLGQVRNSTGA